MIERHLADLVVPMDPQMSLHAPGFVDFDGGRIAAVGRSSDAPRLPPGARVNRAAGILLPGLVNDHAHSSMTLVRGAGEGLPLDRWLTEVIWPREARLTPDDVRVGMVVGALELLLGGVTTTHEMYFFPEAVAAGAVEVGIRAVVSAAVVEAPGLERFGTPDEILQRAIDLRDAHSGEDLIEVGLGPHSAYALGDETLREVGSTAWAEDLPVHIHVAETRTEGDATRERTGKSVPAHLADLGLFAGRATAAHCVWVDQADIALFGEAGVGVAHCPGSNGKLASGIAPVAAMRAAGVPVGAATDGPASNNNLDLWEEARLSLLLARLREEDPAALGVEEGLRMITSEAADALGRPDIGRLEPGSRADMIRISTGHLVYDPVGSPADLLSHLMWAGSSRDVTDVWVGGRRVVRDGVATTVDTAAVRRELRTVAARIAGR